MKRVVCILLFMLCFSAANAQSDTISAGGLHPDSLYMSTSTLAEKIIEEAYRYLGVPYKYGANGPKTFDCTGFTCYVFNKFGYRLSRTSKDQATDGRAVEGGFRNLQKGDILIFGSRRSKKTIGHAGIFIEFTDSTYSNFRFIHASTKKGITISTLSETYYADRFLGARRVLPDMLPYEIERSMHHNPEAGSDYVKPLEQDRNILLREDGTWFYLEEDGRMIHPDPATSIILDGNGRWRTVSNEGKQIPQLTASNRPEVQRQPAAEPREKSSAKYHTVQSGETLSAIARRYKTTVAKLCKLNGLTTKSLLKVGRKIRVK